MMELYAKMFQAVMPGNLEEMAKNEKGSLMGGIKAIFLAWIIGLILAVLGIFLTVGAVGTQVDPETALYGGSVVGGLMIFAVVAAEIIGLVVSIVMGYLMHFAGSGFAKKFFKGTGNFEQQFYIAMLFGGAITILSALVNFTLKLIPFLGTLAGLTGMLFGLYSLYLLYLTVKSVQKMEMVGAVATVIVMIVAVVAIAIVAAFIGAILAVSLGLTAADAAVAGI
jgi:hypothetical protein